MNRTVRNHDEAATKHADTQRALNNAINDIDRRDKIIKEKDAQINGRDTSINERLSDIQRKEEALQAARVEIRRLQEDGKSAEENHKLQIEILQRNAKAAGGSDDESTETTIDELQQDSSKIRRKADRSGTQQSQRVIKDSQSQHRTSITNTVHRQSTPIDEMLDDDGLEYIDPRVIAFEMPPTPLQSSQVRRETFATSTTKSTYVVNQQGSPSKARSTDFGNRFVEDSQDRSLSLSSHKRPSFDTPLHTPPKRSPQSTSAVLRPILKPSNSGIKRSSTQAGHSSQACGPKRRVSTIEAKQLGPTLPDSQSPSGTVRRAQRHIRGTSSQRTNGPKGISNLAPALGSRLILP